jgi:hypothetical protein
MQFGVVSHSAHIETAAGFLVAESLLDGRSDGAEAPERVLVAVEMLRCLNFLQFGKNPATSPRMEG